MWLNSIAGELKTSCFSSPFMHCNLGQNNPSILLFVLGKLAGNQAFCCLGKRAAGKVSKGWSCQFGVQTPTPPRRKAAPKVALFKRKMTCRISTIQTACHG